jgi:AraC-like DNA-binding protein
MMPTRGQTGFQESPAAVKLIAGADRIALCGRFPAIGHHRHAAPAVVVGLDGPLRFVAGRTHASRAALIAPGFSHAVETAGGRIAMFVLPPYTLSGAGGLPVRDLPHPRRWVELGEAVLREELTQFDPIDHCFARERLDLRPVDDRLRNAMEALGQAVDENVSVDVLAASVRLSGSRLMALAREQLGVPLRGYRRWLRAFSVARAYATGASLTDAAFAAGFASSAHLSSATREHFGIRPSDVLTAHNRNAIRAI